VRLHRHPSDTGLHPVHALTHPALWALAEDACARAGAGAPASVTVTPHVDVRARHDNDGVHMLVGLPALAGMSVGQIDAMLACELSAGGRRGRGLRRGARPFAAPDDVRAAFERLPRVQALWDVVVRDYVPLAHAAGLRASRAEALAALMQQQPTHPGVTTPWVGRHRDVRLPVDVADDGDDDGEDVVEAHEAAHAAAVGLLAGGAAAWEEIEDDLWPSEAPWASWDEVARVEGVRVLEGALEPACAASSGLCRRARVALIRVQGRGGVDRRPELEVARPRDRSPVRRAAA